MSRNLLTALQLKSLELITAGNPGDTPDVSAIDLDELLEQLAQASRPTSKPSIQFLIRNLVGKGLIVKQQVGRRRGYARIGYLATKAGADAVSRKPAAPAFHEPEPLGVENL